MWFRTTDPTMRYLLLLSCILILSACSQPELPEELPTPTVPITATTVVVEDLIPAIASPTSRPTAEFEGISIALSEQVLGALQESTHQPDAIDDNGTAHLEHIRLTFAGTDLFDSPELMVFSTAHYLPFSGNAASHMSLLKDMLQDRPVQPRDPLPLFPLPDEAETFYDLPTYINFQNGSGVSFVTQIESETRKQLVYTFQGMTDDEEFYITLLLPLKMSSEILEEDAGTNDTLAQVASRQDYRDLELGDTKDIFTDAIRSLKIRPQDLSQTPAPAAYFTYPGLLLAYDPQISGKATAKLVPPTFTVADGTATFLAGVPDAIQVTFNSQERLRSPVLLIQPLRGTTGQFFPSIPVEQQQQVQELDSEILENRNHNDSPTGKEFERLLTFQNGAGMRHVMKRTAVDGGEQTSLHTYQFKGLTGDGRYFVTFDQPIDLVGSLEEVMLNGDSENSAEFLMLLSRLDQSIESILIAPDASTDSSIPANAPDCTLDAQYIEDLTIPDHTIVERGNTFTKTWQVRNTGTCIWTPAYQIKFAGGNPLSWSQSSLLDSVPPGETTEISVELVSPEIPGKYSAWWQIVNDKEEPFGSFYYVLFEAPRPVTDIPDHGVIEGELSYPAGGMPAMTIYFMRTDGSQRFALETEKGWIHYANELPVGDYYVFARVTGDESESGGGYTAAVLCGMTCDDHELVSVSIEEGKATSGINVFDWYAPAGTFPLP